MYADGTEKDADTIVGEFASNGHSNNLLHEAGVLSMARTTVPDSASSQFFIMHKYSSHLDGEYAAFGYVLAGMDVVNAIATCKVDNPSSSSPMPVQDVVIVETFFVKPLDSTGLGTATEYKICEHTYGEWETTKAASCTEFGSTSRKCLNCSDTQVLQLEKLAHEYSENWDTVKDATCAEYGSALRKCSVCDSTETKKIDKLAHNYADGYCTECDAYNFEASADTEGKSFDTATTGAGTDIDMSKVAQQIGAYSYTDFIKSDEITDFVVLKIKDYGDIVIALRGDVAPETVENFKNLVAEGFYTDIVFHRVIKNFMIQGGYKTSDGGTKSADKITGEFESNGHLNKLNHVAGVISMARANDPDSASSQFFIMHGDASHLDGQYAAFGYVLAGLDVVDAIAKCEVNNPSSSSPSPVEDVVIEEAFFVSPIADTAIAVD